MRSTLLNSLVNGTEWGDLFQGVDDVVYNFPTDICSDQHAYYYRCNLAGVKKDKIDVKVKDGILYITATRDEDSSVKYHYSGNMKGKLSRSFYVPKGVSTDDVIAEYTDGMLTVKIPKSKEDTGKIVLIK